MGFLEEVKYMATQTKYNERHGMNQVPLWRNIKTASFVTGIGVRSGQSELAPISSGLMQLLQ